MVISQMQLGVKLEYSLDCFCVLTLSQFVAIFSDAWATYILYIIPAYIVYKAGSYLFQYLKSRSDAAMTEEPKDDQQKSNR